MRSKWHPSDLSGAVISAAKCAMKHDLAVFVYPSNSYGAFCWRLTLKRSEALCPISNTGRRVLEVAPDRTVTNHTLEG